MKKYAPTAKELRQKIRRLKIEVSNIDMYIATKLLEDYTNFIESEELDNLQIQKSYLREAKRKLQIMLNSRS